MKEKDNSFLYDKVRLFDIFQFYTMSRGVYLIASKWTNSVALLFMISVASFVMFFVYKAKCYGEFYEYYSMEILQGGLFAMGMGFFDILPMFRSLDLGFFAVILSKIITIALYSFIIFLKLTHYHSRVGSPEPFDSANKAVKTKSIVWFFLGMFCLCGAVCNFNIASFIISIPLTFLGIYIFRNRNLEKDIKKNKDTIDRINKYTEQKRAKEKEYYDKMLEREVEWEREMEKRRQYEEQYKQTYREKMGYTQSSGSSNYGHNSTFDYKQKQYEQWYKEHSGNQTTNIELENIKYFKGCKDIQSVRIRYRNLAKAFHPDGNNGDEDSIKELNEEYEFMVNRYTSNKS